MSDWVVGSVNDSLANLFAVYVTDLVLDWLNAQLNGWLT